MYVKQPNASLGANAAGASRGNDRGDEWSENMSRQHREQHDPGREDEDRGVEKIATGHDVLSSFTFVAVHSATTFVLIMRHSKYSVGDCQGQIAQPCRAVAHQCR